MILIIKPIGVITRKKTTPITIGAIMAPKIIPNLNHSLFNGVNSFEFINPKIKKTKEIIADQILTGSSFVKGQVLTIKKTMKKTKPKFLFELIFILEFRFIFIQFSRFIIADLSKKFRESQLVNNIGTVSDFFRVSVICNKCALQKLTQAEHKSS